MNTLSSLVTRQDWSNPLSLAQTLPDLDLAYLVYLQQQHFLDLASPSLPQLDNLFTALSTSPPLLPWLTTALLRTASSPFVSLQQAKHALALALKANDRNIASLPLLSDAVGDKDYERVQELTREHGNERDAVRARRTLLDWQDRATTWEVIWADGPDRRGSVATSARGAAGVQQGEGADKGEDSEADGWEEDLQLPSSAPSSTRSASPPPPELPPPPPVPAPSTPSRPSLSHFLLSPLLTTALSLAASSCLPELSLLCTLHSSALYPFRVRLLEALPEWADVQGYVGLLPRVELKSGREGEWEECQPWRSERDWSEVVSLPGQEKEGKAEGAEEPRSEEQLEEWYLSRVSHLANLGLVAPALSLVQHAASRGVMGLDSLGEELHLLSKLVYDRPLPSSGEVEDEQEDLTLEGFRRLQPSEVLEAYVRYCTPQNLPSTIRRLVLPYLSVLESRLERASTSSPSPSPSSSAPLPADLLYNYLLSLPLRRRHPTASALGLPLLLSVFEASKPTLPSGARIIKSDENLARLAIACLYGAAGGAGGAGGAGRALSEEEVVCMGKIFECLPAFASTSSSPSGLSSSDASPTASPALLFSLPASPSPPSPSLLFALLAPFPTSALSSTLDLLDLHLSQLETFTRYHCAPSEGLAWFLRAYGREGEQRGWATRLARTAAGGGVGGGGGAGGGRGGKDGEGEFEGEDEWVGLMEFMAACTEKGGEGEYGGRAFHLLGKEEVLRIFFGGLLGAGRFSLARALFAPSTMTPPLDPHVVEDLVISASREFYDNAEEGNLNEGEMKLAFECLSAAPNPTPFLRAERSFITSTSRLCSFSLPSLLSSSSALTPRELRHSPDRLAYISPLLLSTSSDAHRHPEVLLELMRGLGYRAGGKAEVRVWSGVGEKASRGGEWESAREAVGRAVAVVEGMRKRRRVVATPSTDAKEDDDNDADAAADYAWKAAFQLGRNEAWHDLEGRKTAIGQALVLCPPEDIATLLPVWTQLEREVAVEKARSAKEEAEGGGGRKSALGGGGGGGLGAAAEMAATFLAAATSAATTPRPSPSPAPAPATPTKLTFSSLSSSLSAAAPSLSASTSTSGGGGTLPHSPRRRDEAAAAAHAAALAGRDLAAEAAERASRTLRNAAAAYLPSFGGGGGAAGRNASRSPTREKSGGRARGETPTSPLRASTNASRPESPTTSSRASTPATAAAVGGRKGKGKLGAAKLGARAITPTTTPSSLGSSSSSTGKSTPPPAPPQSSIFSSPPSSSASASRPPPSPPSRFASAFDSLPSSSSHNPAEPFSSGFGIRAGLSSGLTRGVGWLIGADEEREIREEREREEREREEREREERGREKEKTTQRKEVGKEEEVDEEEWGW